MAASQIFNCQVSSLLEAQSGRLSLRTVPYHHGTGARYRGDTVLIYILIPNCVLEAQLRDLQADRRHDTVLKHL
jgi:hypothetical protein